MTQTTPARVETWDCAHCGAECSRPATKGQRPKWCSQRCADLGKKGRKGTCRQCGKAYRGHGATYCSPGCSNASRRKVRPPRRTPEELEVYWRAQRSPLRVAIDTCDAKALRAELASRTVRNADGCMEWSGKLDRSGYPRASIGGRTVLLHRVVLEVTLGAPLGVQQAHHTCANARCLNPDHLTPATHHANSAEMKARQSYVARIRELEEALRGVAPEHQALSVLPFL